MEKKAVNVLVMGAGSPLGQSIYKALLLSKLPIRFFLSDIRPLAAGFYLRKSSTNIILPLVKDPSYKKELMNAVERYNIRCIFPVIDLEHQFFAENYEALGKMNVMVVTNKTEFHNLASDKYASLVHLKKFGINVPDTIPADDEKAQRRFLKTHPFPILLKPRFGVSSEHIFIVKTENQLNALLSAFPSDQFIIQQYLPEAAEEYTVGVYLSRDGTWKRTFIIRRELKFGLSYTGTVVQDRSIDAYALSVSQALGLQHSSNVQLRMAHGVPYVFEVNPRLSSTTSIRAFFGFNEPEMSLVEFFGDIHAYSVSPKTGSFMRYWEEIYIPNKSL